MSFASRIDGRTLIPDLLRSKPSARPVLDRYGLRGCGGRWGPVETLEFFAKAHEVPIATLLAEIRDCRESEVQPPDTAPTAGTQADAIYRPFFKSGILAVLTVGAAWGAYLLVRIASRGSFSAAGIHEVNAHGHAQIFGWVGLFVMGFAYQAFPRFKHTTLRFPRAAMSTLVLMLAGIGVRSLAEPLAGRWQWLGVVAVIASVLEVIAVGVFVAIIVATFRQAQKPLANSDYYIFCSLGWFLLQGMYETLYLSATLAAPDRDALLQLVRTWQGAMRDIQIHGFALLMILGVSQRIFPNFYGFPLPGRRASLVSLSLINVAVLGEASALVLMGNSRLWAAVWYASVLMLAGTVFLFVRSWRIFGPGSDADRSLKFLRAAYVWLFISLGMLMLVPIYQFGVLAHLAPDSVAAQIGFSHAYYGAVRHAITVGFVSLMIMGVAAKVVPTLNGIDIRALSPLWLPFVLINAGCALRVIAQVLTDFTGRAFPVAGASGVIEVTALTLWGVHIWSIMAGRMRLRPVPSNSSRSVGDDAPVTETDKVGDVLGRFPYLLETFLKHGFTPLANPLLRRTLAPSISITRACRMLNLDTGEFVRALNDAHGARAKRIALPLLSDGSSSASDVPTQPVSYSQSRYPDVAVRKESNPCTQSTPCEANIE